jgi:hypothetical protein
MGNLTLNGSTSGAITISPPAIAGTNTLTLPAVTGTVLVPSSSGSTGQVLTTNGTSPSWVNSWTLINTITGTSAAALQDTTSLTSTYANYMIFIRDLKSTTNAVTLLMQIYTGGAYQTSGYLGGGSTTTVVNFTSTTGIMLTSTSGNNSSYNLTGALYITNPSSSSLYKPVMGETVYYDATGTPSIKGFNIGGAFTTNTNAITGFQISASSGNVTGTVQVYGAN